MHIYDALDNLEKMLAELDRLMEEESEAASQTDKDAINWRERKIGQAIEKWYDNRESYSWDGVAEDNEAARQQVEAQKLAETKDKMVSLLEKAADAIAAGDELAARRLKKELETLQEEIKE